MKYFLTLLFFVVSFSALQSQERWMKLIEQGATLNEVKEAFYSEWEGKEITRGCGYNVFKRWEYFMESRVSGDESVNISKKYMEAFHESEKIFKSSNRSSNGNWESIGLSEWERNPQNNSAYNPGNGRVNVIEKDPLAENTYYVGTPSGGLWRTEDNFQSWQPLSDQIPTLGVTGICIDYTNSDIIYIGTGDGYAAQTYSNGVMKSTDRGLTWQSTALSYLLSDELRVRKLTMHPNDPNILFAATSDGLFKTTTGGETWYKVQTGRFFDVKFKPGNPDIVYACTTRFYKSTDGGEDFDDVDEGTPNFFNVERMIIGVSADEPNYVYLLAGDQENSGYLGMWRSTDSGDNFTLRSDAPNVLGYDQNGIDGENDLGGQAFYDLALDIDPDNAESLFIGGINVWKSINGGTNYILNSYWFLTNNLQYNYVHADIHYIKYIEDELFVCSDGGVFRSLNGGSTFQNVSEGLDISQFYRIGGYEEDPGLIIGGTQDNGSNLLEEGEWTHVSGADGMEGAISPVNPNVIFSSRQNGGIRKSLDGGVSWGSATVMLDDDGRWVTPYVLHPTLEGVYYSGFTQVWKSSDYGATNVQVSELASTSGLVDMTICKSQPNFLYVVDNQRVYKTIDDGNSWLDVPINFYSVFLSYIDVNQNDPDHVVVSYSGFNEEIKVFQTLDGGNTWENISHNLPNIPVNCVTIDHQANDIYAGTDFGVYVLSDSYENWIPFSDQLPNVKVSELEINHQNQVITAATFGRGVWQSDLFTGMEVEPAAAFEADKTIICAGDSITFTDLSYGHLPEWEWQITGPENFSSLEENPTITFEVDGFYTVSLAVQNENGIGSKTEENYIYVNSGLELFPYSEPFSATINSINDLDFQSLSLVGDISWNHNSSVGRGEEGCVWIENGILNEPFVSELVSQTFDLSSVDTAYISFWYAYSQKDLDDDDELIFYTSTNCGESWSEIESFEGEGELNTHPELVLEEFSPSLGNDDWGFFVHSLEASELTENFQFKFRFLNDNGNHVYIDDINITSDYVNVAEISSSFIAKVFPVPAGDVLSVKLQSMDHQAKEIILLNSLGQQTKHQSIPARNEEVLITMDVSNLSSGLYYMQLVSDAGKPLDTQKVIIR